MGGDKNADASLDQLWQEVASEGQGPNEMDGVLAVGIEDDQVTRQQTEGGAGLHHLNCKDQLVLLMLNAVVLVGCARTTAQIADAAPKLPPTCAAAVHLFMGADRVGAEYADLGLLRVAGGLAAGEGVMFRSLRSKAAELGANGLIYRSMDADPGLFKDPRGEAVAIYIPSDMARVAPECAKAAAAQSATDSAAWQTRSPLGN